MAVKLGTAYVDIEGNFDTFQGGLDGLLKGSKWKAVTAGVAGIGAAAIGAGAALYSIGSQFDDAYDTIRTNTGKTGKDLDGLKGDFKNVVKNVPTDFGSAADAVSTLNQRLGLTGKPLQGLSSQFLELSRLTGTDLKTNIESATRAFGDWGVKTKNQPAALDKLFRAFQQTGVPVAKLSDLITKYGAPLRQLGFGFSEATALVGQFEKAGVNTQLVMGSMRIALGKMAKSGEEPIDTFKRVTEAIKNTGSTSEANKMALELFGARAGPDMAAAIREGKFSIDDLAKSIAGGGDTIMKAGKDTQDFSEKWQLFKNKVMVWLEPLAAKVFGGMADAMDAIGPAADKIRDAFEQVVDRLKGGEGPAGKFGQAFASLKDAISGVVDIAVLFWEKFGGPIKDLFVEVGKAVVSFAENVTQVLGGVIDLVAGIFTGDWKRAWDGIKNIFSGVWGAFRDIVNLAWELVKTAVRTGLSALGAVFEEFGEQLLGLGGWVVDQIVAGLKKAWEGLKDLGGWIKDQFVEFIKAEIEGFKTIGGWVIDRVVEGVKAVASAVKDAGGWLKDKFTEFVKAEIEGWKAIGRWLLDKVVDGIKTITEALGGVGGWIKNRVRDGIEAAADGFKSIGSWVTNRVADGIKTLTDALGSVGGWIKNRVVDGIEGLKDGFVSAGSWVINRIAEGIKTITDALGSVGGWLKNRVMDGIEAVKDGFTRIGGKVIDWIVDGLKGGANLLVGFVNRLIRLINKIPGVDIGEVKGFAMGGQTGDLPAFAQGGVMHHSRFAKGGEITRPMLIVGEEAPRHNEFVIPTNPAYRPRALGLFGQLAQELGIPGYVRGGVNAGSGVSGGGDWADKNILATAFDWARNGVSGLLNKLPGIGDLPDWIRGTASWLRDKAGDWLRGKIGSILGGGGPTGRLVKMIERMDAIDAKGFPYSYGGGHSPGTFDGPYDCSGLVSAILRAGGLLSGAMTTDGLKVYGDSGDGRYITIGVRGSTGRNAHTMMRIGDRYLESGSGHGAKWVSGWSGSFPIHRHPPGMRTGGVLNQEVARLLGDEGLGWGLRKGGVVPFVGSYQQGGIVPADGIAQVHQGETIVPNGFQPEIRVFLGTREIEDLVRVEVDEQSRQAGATFLAGALR